MIIIKNRRFLSAIPLTLCCLAISLPMTLYAETPVVTTVLDEAPPPWDGTIRQGTSNAASTRGNAGIAEWYQQRKGRQSVSGQQLQSLQSRANGGDTEAIYQLGLLYQSGRGVSTNPQQARKLFEQAARAGNAHAQYSLALLYRQQDNAGLIQQSVNWQQKAAQQGHAEAQYGLGMLYANGQYVPRDPSKARHWLQQAAQRNHSMAGLALQDLTSQMPRQVPQVHARPQAVRPAPQPVAAAANTSSYAAYAEPVIQAPQQQVAALTPQPEPPPRTTVEQQQSQVDLAGKSTAEIRRAAERGDKYAQLMYGAMFEDGAGGIKRDPAQAMRWYLRAARQGYPKAQHNLALLYEDGKGVPQDYQQAAIWYQKAAAAGFSEAQNNLAVLYILGNGVAANRGEAERLLRAAVAQGNANAKRNLDMLLNGEG